MKNILFKELSDKVIGLGIKVHKELGPGLGEKVYETALCIELANFNIRFERQKEYPVYYCGQNIGVYYADIVVENCIVLELKAVSILTPIMETQLVNYLRLSKIRLGYLLNFNSYRLVFKRFIRV